MKTLTILISLAIATHTASAEPVADRAVALANAFFKRDLPVLTLDLVGLHVDLPRAVARVRVGAGDTRFAALHLSGDINVADGTAQIRARLAFAVAGQRIAFALPELDVTSTSYRDHVDKPERGIEVVMPFARQRF